MTKLGEKVKAVLKTYEPFIYGDIHYITLHYISKNLIKIATP